MIIYLYLTKSVKNIQNFLKKLKEQEQLEHDLDEQKISDKLAKKSKLVTI